jgi:fatty acid desaturase
MATATAHMKLGSHVGPTEESARFVRQVREIVKDLIEPNPRIFWIDMLLTMAVAHAGFAVYALSELWSAPFWIGAFVAGLAFYRGTIFSHEITHFHPSTFKNFRHAWNALCGVPLLFPEFIYEDHISHHVNHSYGTPHDGEYLPLGTSSWKRISLFLLQAMLVPAMGLFRFVVLAPLSWVFPKIRHWVWTQSTAAVTINLAYEMPVPTDPAVLRRWKIQEVICFIYGASFLGSMAVGLLPWSLYGRMYCLFLGVALLNYTRMLGAHRYMSGGQASSYLEQLLDSYTVPGSPLITELWAPLGMRYHALHHLVPSMPYHNLGKAHRRLVEQLPVDSPYRATIRRNLGECVVEVLRSSWRARHSTAQAA